MESVLADQLPLFPLGTVLFPGMVLPLHIFEDRYKLMMVRRMDTDPMCGVVLTRSGREVGDQPEICATGTTASLVTAVRYGDGRYDIAVRGGQRFEVFDEHWDHGYLTGTVKWIPEADSADDLKEQQTQLFDLVSRAYNSYLDALRLMANARIEPVELGSDPVRAAYAICSMMPFGVAQRQHLLEAPTSVQLLAELLVMLRRERGLLVATGVGGAAIDHPGAQFTTN